MGCGNQVGSVTDEKTGNTIEIYRISPTDLCTSGDLNDWMSKNPNAAADCMEDKCPSDSPHAKVTGTYLYISHWSIVQKGNGDFHLEGSCEYSTSGTYYVQIAGADETYEGYHLKKIGDPTESKYCYGQSDCVNYEGSNQYQSESCGRNNSAIGEAANTDNWFSYSTTSGLPGSFVAVFNEDCLDSYGYKDLKVEKPDNYTGSATGIKVCITKLTYKDNQLVDEQTSSSTIKWGGELSVGMASGTHGHYTVEDDRERECRDENGETQTVQTKSCTYKRGEDTKIKWEISVINYTYDD